MDKDTQRAVIAALRLELERVVADIEALHALESKAYLTKTLARVRQTLADTSEDEVEKFTE